jgi:cytochrome c oxidase assembly protein subunit 11
MEKNPPKRQDSEDAAKTVRQNRRAVYGCLAGLAVMGSITAASPTLYTMFCKATGYGGTTQRAETNTGKVLDRTITVRFDSNVAPGLAWTFEPDVTKMEVKIGETALAFFRATNNSDKPVTFFLDPKLVEDSSTAQQPEVTLSYSFFAAEHPKATAEVAPAPPKTGG